MKKSLFASILLSTFVLSMAISPSHAAAKAGAKCPKVGVKEIVGKTTFTCIKSGKKLVWNAGVAIKKKQPSNTTSPLASGPKAALESFSKFPKSKESPQKLNFNFGPNADKDFSEMIVKNANATMELFVDFYQDSKPYPIFYGSNEDLDWLVSEWGKYGWTEETLGENFKAAITNVRNRSTPPNFSVGSDNRFPQSPMILIGSKSALSNLTTPWREIVIHHHVIHGVQSRIMGYKDGLLGCWGREGGAEFYGWVVASRTLGTDYLSHRRSQIGDWIKSKPKVDLRKFTEAEWLATLKTLEGDQFGDQIYCGQESGNLAYNTGAILYERLVGEFGHENVMNWWYKIGQTNDWKLAFEQVFKVNIDDWYKKSAIPYLIKEYRDWVPNPGWRGVG